MKWFSHPYGFKNSSVTFWATSEYQAYKKVCKQNHYGSPYILYKHTVISNDYIIWSVRINSKCQWLFTLYQVYKLNKSYLCSSTVLILLVQQARSSNDQKQGGWQTDKTELEWGFGQNGESCLINEFSAQMKPYVIL